MAVERAVRKEEVNRFLAKSVPVSSDRQKARRESNESNEEDDDDDASSSSSSSLGSQGSGDQAPMPGQYFDAVNEVHLSHSLLDRNISLETSSLILSPHRASPLESRWLDEIVSRFPENGETQSLDATRGSPHNMSFQASVRKSWPTLIKYFNGYDALEKISVREGLKRKPTWQVLTRLGLVTGQSSVELDSRERVLVSVRHW